jgi:type VI secretion system protein ImpG
MDGRLLRHYEAELSFMREMGAEFATAFPKIASRLGMDGVEVLDPYVERLLEGVAFLNARVQLELELQYPAFTSHLLDIIYPHYQGPTPSMMVAELVPDFENAALESGYVVPRHSVLRSRRVEGTQSACVFRTAHDVALWPVEIAEAEYIDGRGELVAAGVAGSVEARAGLRLRLRRTGDQPLGDLELDRLTVFLGGEEGAGHRLYELFCSQTTAVVARSTNRRADWVQTIAGGVEPRGFSSEEALLPVPRRAFDGYRLLQEYFAMPERFHFIDIAGLGAACARAEGSDIDIYFLLKEGDADVAERVTPAVFRLNCTPAVNLYEKRCDRVPVTPRDVELHVVVDRTAPLDFEVHSIETVVGISGTGGDDVVFRPFYSADESSARGSGVDAYYTLSRQMRQRTERERLKGTRTNYLGSEAYISLVDPRQAPFGADLRQIAVTAMVTNRDLPLLLTSGAPDVFHLPEGGPVAHVHTPVVPTRPRPTLAQGSSAWRLINHLGLNYLSIADSESGGGADALRELIGLYAPEGDRIAEKQIEGIVRVDSRPIVRRIRDETLSTAVRGIEIALECDEDYFEGTGAYLLAAVLERFFRAYVAINSFTETVLITQQRGEVARWRPEKGLARVI